LHGLFGWIIDPPAGYYKCHVCGRVCPGDELVHNVFPWLHVCPATGCGASVVPVTEEENREYAQRARREQEIAAQEAERARREAAELEQEQHEQAVAEQKRQRLEQEARAAAALHFGTLYTSIRLCAETLPSDEKRGELLELLAEVQSKVSVKIGVQLSLLKTVVAAVCRQFPEIWPDEAIELVRHWAMPLCLQDLLDDLRPGWAVVSCSIPDCPCCGLIIHRHCAVELTTAELTLVHAMRVPASEQEPGDVPNSPCDGGMEGDGASLAGGEVSTPLGGKAQVPSV